MDHVVAAEVEAVRHHAGVWIRGDHTFIRFTGRDVAEWLHSQTSNDVTALQSGEGHANALLDRQGRLRAHFTLHRWEDEYWALVERQQAARLMEQLDAHLFIEDVTMEETGDELDQVVVQGPRTLGLLAAFMDTEDAAAERLPGTWHGCRPIQVLGHDVLAFRISLTGEDGYVLVAEAGEGEALREALLKPPSPFVARAIGKAAREVLRVEAGIPRFGVDMDTSHRIPETTLERHAVSYDKGCYLGQEVVARLRAYGSVKQALMGLVTEAPLRDLPEPGSPLYVDGRKAGRLMSRVFSPSMESAIAFAYLDRDHRTPGVTHAFRAGDGREFSGRAVVLPFVETPSRETRARALYEEALGRFERDMDDVDASAIPLLKEAVLLAPDFEDAYEALGVILHRHHRLDEAIRYMRILARMNPNSLMAHTNLSVFYVAKGMIEEAEEEKAKAAVLGIQRASDERKAKEMAEAERKRLVAEAEERIGMFKEVLEIDPDDPVATFGMGKACIQLNRYDEAIPYLKRATKLQGDYSAAYLSLGKCHEFLQQLDEAVTVYRRGIEVASRKGDLMPLREMERRLNALRAESSPAP